MTLEILGVSGNVIDDVSDFFDCEMFGVLYGFQNLLFLLAFV